MTVLEDVMARAQQGGSVDLAAEEVVREWRARGDRIPGFGHRVHATDPRTQRLFALAEALGFHTPYDDAARAIEAALTAQSHKPIPMNLDGAIAAVLCGLGFPSELANPLFMISRFVGITMQAYEETTRHRPMRKIYPDRFHYDGVELREVPVSSGEQR
jgi:citrate synthase